MPLSGITKGLVTFESLKNKCGDTFVTVKINSQELDKAFIEKLLDIGDIIALDGQIGSLVHICSHHTMSQFTIRTSSMYHYQPWPSLGVLSNFAQETDEWALEETPFTIATLLQHGVAPGHQFTLEYVFLIQETECMEFEKTYIGINGGSFFIQKRPTRDNPTFSIHVGQQSRALTLFNESSENLSK